MMMSRIPPPTIFTIRTTRPGKHCCSAGLFQQGMILWQLPGIPDGEFVPHGLL
jgi:hypothetical protein